MRRLFVLYVILSVLDGVFTYTAVGRWGLAVERNPVVLQQMVWLGPALGLLAAKVSGCAVAFMLVPLYERTSRASVRRLARVGLTFNVFVLWCVDVFSFLQLIA